MELASNNIKKLDEINQTVLKLARFENYQIAILSVNSIQEPKNGTS